MTVVLEDRYKNDLFIGFLNDELTNSYGANVGAKFNTTDQIEEELDYLNHDPKGRQEAPGLKRPIARNVLIAHCYWLRFGEFSFKLSGADCPIAARDAVAVCKWLIKTKCKYINRQLSCYYDIYTVRNYLDFLYEESGHDLQLLWMGYELEK